jgi:16S rRNA (guanine527-N7)-methyltransferase
MASLEKRLAEGLEALNISAEEAQRARLLGFLNLLRKWNRVYNLTSITDPAEMVSLHLLDSLAVLPHLKGERILDVGTGAGLPGIPLALLSPDKQFTLLDSNAKKTRFVQQAAIELKLPNVRVEHARIEHYRPSEGFDTVIARAFASLAAIVSETSRLLNPRGVILAQKGKLPEDELAVLENLDVEAFPLSIPGVVAARHIIAIQNLRALN